MKKLIKLLDSYFVYLFALGVVGLNVSLIFDNVLWGDEAFSANTISGTGVFGIIQRVFYLDSHPPLYYLYLKLITLIGGESVPVLHLASILPFVAGIALVVFFWKKKTNSFSVLFFVLFSGLAATCAEYNQEVRMYEFCFFAVLLSAYFSYLVLTGDASKRRLNMTFAVICGVVSAYTHYYGFVTTGILIFMTGLFNLVKDKESRRSKENILMLVLAPVGYLLLYSPWLYTLFRQMKTVAGSWWMDAPAPLLSVVNFVFGGGKLVRVFVPFFALVVIAAIFLGHGDKKRALFMFLSTMICTVGFAYFMSYVFRPILAERYMYPIVPLMLTALMIAISLLIGENTDGAEEVSKAGSSAKDVEESSQENSQPVAGADPGKTGYVKYIKIALAVIWAVSFVIALFDFKYYRSVVKTENVQTERILAIIGEPDSDVIFTSTGVKHLSWTVLKHYYPNNEILDLNPLSVEGDPDEMWGFIGYELPETTVEEMRNRGYEVSLYEDMWMGKYGCNLYHFVK